MPGPEIPAGLVKLLQDFTVAILRAKPDNLEQFGAEFFNQRLQGSRTESTSEEIEACPLKVTPSSLKTGGQKGKLAIKTAPADNPDDSDSEFEMSMEKEMSNKKFTNRRASVAAEPYNPEDDEEATDGNGRKLSFHEKSPETKEHLKSVCKKIVLFGELDENELDDLVNAMFDRSTTAGEDIIEELDDADNFYIIESGKYEAKISDPSGEDKVVKEYDNFGYFGELALMYNAPRSATITSVTDGQLWALSRTSFRKLVLGHAAKRRRAFVELLHSVKILTDLSPYQRMALADSLVRKSLSKGECIINEGDPGKEIFFVMDGVVKVVRNEDGTEKELAKIEKGGYFGELALLSSKPRAASVYADTDVSLAVLGVESFERLLGPCIDLMRRNASVYKGLESGHL